MGSIPQGEVLFEGDVWGGNLAVDAGRVYFTTFGVPSDREDEVWSVDATGGARVVAWRGVGGIFGVGMAVEGDYVYWSQDAVDDGGVPGVYRALTRGGPRELLGEFPTSQAAYGGVVTDGTNVYAGQHDSIISVPLAGGAVTTLYSGEVGSIRRSVDGTALYFSAEEVLMRVPLPAGTAETVRRFPGARLGAVAIDATSAFVTMGTAILRVPLDGADTETVADGLERPGSIVLSDEHVYAAVVLGDHHAVVRAPIGGGEVTYVLEVFAAGSPTLALDDDALYAAYCCGDATSGGAVVRVPR